MAKVHEEVFVIKLSRLVKDSAQNSVDILPEDFDINLEDIVQELVGDNIIVEIEKGK